MKRVGIAAILVLLAIAGQETAQTEPPRGCTYGIRDLTTTVQVATHHNWTFRYRAKLLGREQEIASITEPELQAMRDELQTDLRWLFLAWNQEADENRQLIVSRLNELAGRQVIDDVYFDIFGIEERELRGPA